MLRRMNKLFSILLIICLVFSLIPPLPAKAAVSTVYLKVNSEWKTDSARFAAYFFDSSGNYTWVSMTSKGNDYYSASVPSGKTSVIFCRMNPSSSTNSWDYKWNQTGDLTVPSSTSSCVYTMTSGSWDSGSWGACPHIYNSGSVTKAATCTATGTKTYTCTVCGGTKTESIAALGHNYAAATCTVAKKCTRCSATSGSALGHNYSYAVSKSPTTSASGTLKGTCSRCSGTTSVTLPALTTTNYTRSVQKAATCTATGTYKWVWKTTTYGTFSFTSSIAATGHSYAAATCTKAKTCSTCGATSGSALGHSYSYAVSKSPTTSATGTLKGTCSRCSGTTSVTLPTLTTTNYTRSVQTAATCTATGTYKWVWKTTTYGTFSFTSSIAATGHSYAAATCTKAKTCSTCGATSGSALGHNYSYAVTKDPTTSASGTLVGTCSRCSGTTGNITIGKLGTTYHTYKVTKAATCTTAGTGRYTWNITDYGTYYWDVTIAATGHSYAAATCTAPKTCTTCGATSGSANGHSYTSKVTTAATCTAAGVRTYTCSACSNSYTESIAATGHSYTGGKCSSCGDTKVVSVAGTFNSWSGANMTYGSSGYTYSLTLSAGSYEFKIVKDGAWLGNNGTIVDTTTATSSVGWEFVDGYNNCVLQTTGGTYNFTFKYDTNMLIITYSHTHAYTAGTVVAPTCTAKGYTVYTCACGNTENRDETAALGHSYTSKVTTAAGCTTTGVRTYTCSRCSNSYTESIAATGHSYTSKVTAATCTAQGYTTHTCSTCSNSYKDTYTAALGHNYSYAKNVDPTTSAAGSLKGTCSRCSGTTTVTVPKLNTTDYTRTTTTAATCTATGTYKWTWKTTDYGTFSWTSTIAATGHSYGNASCTAAATCTVCGATTGSALGHNYVYAVTKDPTTSASGTLVGTCSRCSATTGNITIGKLGTTYHTYKVTKAATCTTAGTGRYTWNITDYGTYYWDVTIPATGHSYAAATCTKPQTCSTCGATIGSANGHSYTSKVTTAATCTTAGVRTYTCSVCSDSYTESIAATGHSYSSKVTAPTCTAQGYTTYTCSVCSNSYKDNYTDATGHSYVGGKCSSCGDTKVVSVNGSFNDWAGANMTYGSSGYTYSMTLSAGTYEFKIVKDGAWMGNNGTIEDTTTKTSDIGWEFVGGDGYGNCTLVATGGTYYFTFVYDTNMLVITYSHTHAYTAGTVVAPTCTAKGYTVYTCACGDSYNGDETAALGHSYTSKVTTSATCTTAGVKTYTCSNCGDNYTESIAATGHSYSSVVTAPTCTAQGYTTHTCGNCGDSYKDTYTAALGHNYQNGACTNCGDTCVHSYTSKVTKEATCTTDGVRTYTCSICSASYTEAIAKLGHSYSSVVTAPTCTDKGYTTYTCSKCDDTYTANETAALGHSYSSAVTTAPGCTTTGVRTYTCSRCSHSYTETIAANGHSYSSKVTAPTCTAQGYTTYTCSVCSNSYKDNYTDAAGHSYVGGKCSSCGDTKVVTLAGTFNEWAGANMTYGSSGYTYSMTLSAGTYEFKVVKDGAWMGNNGTIEDTTTKTSDIGWEFVGGDGYGNCVLVATGGTYNFTFVYDTNMLVITYTHTHAYAAGEVVAPTCTAKGYTVYTCACGDSYNGDETAALGHSYTSKVTTATTCTTAGVRTYTCSTCGDSYTETIAANGHSYSSKVTAPTCTAQGYTTHTCGNCGDSYKDTYTAATGHDWNSDGTCNNCGTGCDHSWNSGVITTAATCTTDGVKTFTCSTCGDTYTEVIAKLGHSYESVVTAPTCTAKGYTTYTCSTCGDTYTADEVAALGHNYSSEVTTAATCTTDGVRTYTCSNCSDTYTEVIAATGHNYVGGKCGNCGDTKVVSVNGSFNDWAGANMTWTENGYTFNMVLSAGSYEFKIVKDGAWMGNNGTIEDTTTKTSDIGWEFVGGYGYGNCTLIATGGTYYFTFVYDTNMLVITYDHTHAYAAGEVVAPTCTAKGYTVYTCACGDSYNGDEKAALGHSYTSEVTTAATCTADGVKTFTCSTCGDSYTEVIAAIGHDYKAVVTAPTCTAQGYTTHTCGNCGDSYKDTYTDATGHDWNSDGVCENCGDGCDHSWNSGEVTTQPTCTTAGVKTFTCATCNGKKTEAIDATGHSYGSKVTAPTCTEVGYTTYTCSECDDTYTADEVAALGHNYSSEVTTAATCTTDGVRTYTCSNCSDTYTEVIAATGHNYVGGKCENCGDTKVVSVNGSFNDWAGANMTWTADGYTLSVDLVAGTYEFKVVKDGAWMGNNGTIEDTTTKTSDIGWEFVGGDGYGNCTLIATGGTYYFTFVYDTNMLVITYDHTHAYTAGEVVAPTCTEGGYTVYTCACGDSYNGDETAALGHSYTSEVTTAATCTADGVKTYTCSTCGDSYTEVIAALGHSYGSVVTAPTCTEAGYTTYTCDICGDSYVSDETAALGHSYVGTTCTACGNVRDYYLIGFINGADVGDGSDAANTGSYKFVDGKVTMTITDNSYVFVKTGDNAAWYMTNGYDESLTSVTLYNTNQGIDANKLFVPGGVEVTFTLVVNDDETLVLSYTINSCEHSYTSETVDATCTTAGSSTYTCSKCGDSYTEEIPATGHNYVGDTCVNCGDVREYYLFGFINGADYAYGDDSQNLGIYKFVDGKLVATFTENSYVAVKTGDNKCWYMASAYTTDKTVTLYNADTGTLEKLFVPGGAELTFTLVVNDDDTVVLSYEITNCSHNYVGEVTTAPTCTTAGVKTFTCSICGDSYTEEVAALGHTYENDVCTVCGKVDPASEYYLIGWINGADYGCNGDEANLGIYKFVDGKLVVTFESDSYVFVKTGDNLNWYMANGLCTDKTVTLYNTNSGIADANKLFVPGGVEIVFTLVVNEDDTLTLSYVIPMCEHNYGDGVVTKEATCTETGVRTFTCSICGTSYTEEIPALGHSYEANVTAPTCTEGGYTTYTCACGDSYIADELAALGHNYVDGVCDRCGDVEKVIDYYLVGYINGAYYGCEDDESNMGIYKFVDGKLVVHFTEGSYVFIKTTDNANWYMTEGFDASATSATLYNTNSGLTDPNKLHVPGGVEVTFTLVNNGDDTFTLSYTTGECVHSYDAGVQTKAPTCAEVGENLYTCTYCGHTYTEEIAKLPHSYVGDTCTSCGDVREYYLVGWINGADYGCNGDEANLGIYKFVDGKLVVTFESDSYVFIKTGDNLSWYMANGLCTDKTVTLYNTNSGIADANKLLVPGNVEVTFTLVINEDDTLTLSYQAAECEHSYTEEITTAATCTTAGVKTFTCSACGDSYTEEIPATGHNYVDGTCQSCGEAEPVVEYITVYFQNNWLWTDVYVYYWNDAGYNAAFPGEAAELYGNDGTYDIYCVTMPADCSVIFSGTKNDGSGASDQTPDITDAYDGACYSMVWNDGNDVNVDDIENVMNPAECEHSYTEEITTAATCTTAGVKTYTCSACGDSYTEEIPATGHNYVDGSCTNCGEAEPVVEYITVYFQNNWLWTDVYVYYWNADGSNAEWPGEAAELYGNDGTYDIYCVTMPADCSVIFSGTKNDGSGASDQTPDITDAYDGACYSMVWDGDNSKNGVNVDDIENVMPSDCEHSYTAEITKDPTCHEAGETTYTCDLCGDVYTEEIPATGHTYVNGVCSVCGYSQDDNIRIHFVNTLGWQGVVGYAWINTGSTTTSLNGIGWPGVIVQRDNDGYYTMELEYTPVSGESIGILFHDFNGNQTADLTISYATLTSSHDIWIKPATTQNSAGKYSCTVVASESGTLISPEVNGQEVTFRYSNSSATAVYLAGNMNGWSSTATAMTKDENGYWTVTLTLDPGVYEYKFVVDGSWYLDPCNGSTGGYDGNSVVVVPADDTTTNNGRITVVLHFYRASGDYSGWDVWYWGEETNGAASFTADTDNKGMIATFTIDGTKNSNVGYVIRKSDWSDQEFYDRFIDLSDVASGTVHYYVTSGVATGSRVLGEDVISVGKLSYADYNYDTDTIWVKSSLPLANPVAGNFSIVDGNGNATGITVTSAALDGNGYKLTLSKGLTLTQLNTYKVEYDDSYATITLKAHDLFYSSKFASEYTYNGNDLGATWSAGSTTFKVWAPTAQNVHVKIYDSGNWGSGNQVKYVQMTAGDKGVWSVTVSGNWHGYYYNYDVTFPGYTVEATDPYARSTGVNGDRGMILNLNATDPAGWDSDISPNKGMSYTDAVIYEMHVREFTLDSNSGVNSAWRGKFMGLTQTGTSYNGHATGLDYLKELGVTHVQLMPVYDFKSVDEYYGGYAWGYDPQNYNVPEGSYSTDPYDGSVRVNEFKEMVQTFHENGINVVMDVVYNHAFDGGNFCYNKIVPNYFSRFYGEGNWSNGSGCGNDMATERTMARNYIVDSILYWVEEYHIDGFRFDLAGLIDTTTINEIVNTVHAKYPYVIFYGEGWAAGDTAVEYGNSLATKGNAWQTPGFGYFNDDFRNGIAGDNGKTWGFASGSWDYADRIASWFRAGNSWANSPSQSINYVSAHDNYCLTDKLMISRNGAYWDEIARMNALSASVVMLSEGVPFLYSGDEMLREKKDYNGNRVENGYSGGDYANQINWADLTYKEYAGRTSDYYAGLIEFRKNHAALRCTSGSDAWNYVTYHKISDQTILMYVSGYPNYECSDGIAIIFNANSSSVSVNLDNYLPSGYWQATIHGTQAGVTPLWGVNVGSGSGTIGVDGISTTVLVLGDLIDENSVYNKQASKCSHASHNTSAMCTSCGKTVSHTYVNGSCSICGLSQSAPSTYTVYYDNSTTQWSNVYIYSWTTTAGQTNEYTGAWAGASMTLIDEENGIYAYELPIGAQNIIFSGDGSQSDNLTAPGYASDATLYSDGSWITYEGACEHSYTDTVVIEATCTTAGEVIHTCDLCGYSYTEAVEATGHSYEETVVDPTCTTGGYTSHTCSSCGDSYNTDEIAALRHSYENDVCTVCGTVKTYFLFGYINGSNYGSDGDEATMGIYEFVDGKLVATFKQDSYVGIKTIDNENWYMTDGYLGEEVTSATLYDTSTGIDANKLFVPGGMKVLFTMTVNEDGTLTLSYETAQCEHSYESVVTDPTCTENGYTTHTCTLCGDSYTDTEVEALGHSFADGICQNCGAIDPAVCEHTYGEGVVTEPTCTEGGYTTYTCSICGHSYTDTETEALGHTYESVVTEPTCTEDGYTTYTCSVCGDSYTDAVTEATGHNFVDGFCDVCGAVDPATCEHTYESVVTEPTCTEAGYTTNTCPICGNVEITDETEALGHTYESVVTDPTCTEAGYTTHTCATCGDSYTDTEVEMIDHTFVDGICSVCGAIDPATCEHEYESVITDPTCTEAGYTTHTCSKCGDSYTDTETEMIDHTFVDGICSVCGAIDPAICEHTYESVVTDPTCTEAGYTTHTCSACGDSYTDTEVEATGHSFVDGVCEHCGEEEGGTVECDHEYVKTAATATCTEQGGDKYTCSKCGDFYLENATDALGHNYVDGICDRCGDLKPLSTTYYLVGWINGGNHGCEEDGANMGNYPITDNMFKYTFDQTSYVFLKTEGNGKWFMCDGYPGDGVCFANLYDTSLPIQHDKVNVPGGIEITFTLIERDDGSVTLTYVTAGNCSHNWYTQTQVWPGCTTTGVMLHRCIMCAESYTTTIAATGHSYNGGSNCWNCGAANPNYTYYYQIVGWINGQNVGCEENWEQAGYQFSGNRLTMTFTENSYIYIKTHDNSKWYMTDGYPGDDATSATFYHTDSYWDIQKDKMFVPKGRTITFTLSVRSDNTIYLSYVAASCQHTYDSWTNVEATCVSDGEVAYKCTKCDDYYTAVVKATGHTYSGTSCTKCGAVAPGQPQIYYLVGYINGANYGCEDDKANMGSYKFVDGQLIVTFSVDSYVFLKTQGNTQWFMTQSFVETNSGTFFDTGSGANEKMKVPGGVEYRFTLVENADGSLTLTYGPSNCAHSNVTEEVTAPTCTEKGYTTLICQDCGNREITNEVEPVGHSYVDGKCEHCGAPDPAVCQHVYDEGVVTAPTCTAKGYTTFTCTLCGTVTTGNETDMIAHDFVDGVCSVCGAEDLDPSEIFYLVGYINGSDYACNDDYQRLGIYKFVDGKLMVKFASDSYVYLKTGDNANWFMTAEYVSGTTGTFVSTSTGAAEKMLIPGGQICILTLVDNGDGTFTLSYEIASCDHELESTVTAPTCTENGYTTHSCNECGISYCDSETAATGHSFVDGTCSVCGEAEGEKPEEPDTITVYFRNNWLWSDVYVYYWNDAGSNAEWPGIAATYYGNDGEFDIYCVTMPADAKVIFSGTKNDGSGASDQTPDITDAYDGACYSMTWNDGNAVEVDDIDNVMSKECQHTYESVVTASTCKTGGYTTHTCSKCSDSYTDTYTAPLGHTYVDDVCTVCGEAKVEELQDFYLIGYINGANYGCDEDWENLGIYKFVDGKLVVHFKQNSYVFIKTGDNMGWYMASVFGGENIPYADLFNTSTGANEKLFVPGGMKITFVLVRTGEDTFILGYTAEPCEHPSHTITGKCEYCGEYVEHTYESVGTAHSCTVDGGVKHTCTVCGVSYTTDVVPATGHIFVDGICKLCGVADENGCAHEYEMNVDSGYCHLGAFTVNTCTLCGHSYNVYYKADMDWTLVKPEGIHDDLLETKTLYSYSDRETTTSDTDTLEGWTLIGSELIDAENGIYEYTFERWTEWSDWSDEVYEETEDRKVQTITAYRNSAVEICEHEYIGVVTDPTCTDMGYTTYTCSRCGESYVSDYTDALGHTYESEVIAPTCTEVGCTKHTCSVCGDSYTTDEVEAAGHSYGYTFVDGIHTLTCDLCGDVQTTEGSHEFKFRTVSLTFASDISIVYKASVDDCFTDVYVTFKIVDQAGNVYEALVTDYTIDEATGRRVYVYEGINPQRMGDNLVATLTGTLNDQQVTFSYEYSVLSYCQKQLNKTNISDEYRTLISDLLVYGAKAQILKDYNTDYLVTDGIEGMTPSTFPGVDALPTYVAVANTELKNDTHDLKSYGLELTNKIALKFGMVLDDPTLYTYQVTINGVTETYDASVLTYDETKDRYYLPITIMVTNMERPVTVTILQDGVQVSRAMTYSVVDYIKQRGNEGDAMSDLLQALYNYGEAAVAYQAAG